MLASNEFECDDVGPQMRYLTDMKMKIWCCVQLLFALSVARAQSPAVDRDVSWKKLVPNILDDQARIWSLPVRLAQGRDLLPAAAVTGVTAGLAAGVDPIEGNYFRNTHAFGGFNNIFTSSATSYGMIAVPTVLYAAGFFRKDAKMKNTALLAGEAVADVEIVTEVLKTAEPPTAEFRQPSRKLL